MCLPSFTNWSFAFIPLLPFPSLQHVYPLVLVFVRRKSIPKFVSTSVSRQHQTIFIRREMMELKAHVRSCHPIIKLKCWPWHAMVMYKCTWTLSYVTFTLSAGVTSLFITWTRNIHNAHTLLIHLEEIITFYDR